MIEVLWAEPAGRGWVIAPDGDGIRATPELTFTSKRAAVRTSGISYLDRLSDSIKRGSP